MHIINNTDKLDLINDKVNDTANKNVMLDILKSIDSGNSAEEIIEQYNQKICDLSVVEYYILARRALAQMISSKDAAKCHALFKAVKSPEFPKIEKERYYKDLIHKNILVADSADIKHLEEFFIYLLSMISQPVLLEKNLDGSDVMQLVIKNNHGWALQHLKGAGVDINWVGGESSLYYACNITLHAHSMIKALLDTGIERSIGVDTGIEKGIKGDNGVDIHHLLWNRAFEKTVNHLSVDAAQKLMTFISESGFERQECEPPLWVGGLNLKETANLLHIKDELGKRDIYERSALDFIFYDKNLHHWLKNDISHHFDYQAKDILGRSSFDKAYENETVFKALLDFFMSWNAYSFIEGLDTLQLTGLVRCKNYLGKLLEVNQKDSELDVIYDAFEEKKVTGKEERLFHTLMALIAHIKEDKTGKYSNSNSTTMDLFKHYLVLKNLITFYSSKIHDTAFPAKIQENLENYLESIAGDDITWRYAAGNPMKEEHKKSAKNLLAIANMPSPGHLDSPLVTAWYAWVESHPGDIMKKVALSFDGYAGLHTLSEEIKEKEIKEGVIEPKEDIVPLYTDAALERFQKERAAESKDTKAHAFMKKLESGDYNKKTFAKSSGILAGIELFYQRFPHFEPVISHIESYARLQEKGNGAFYIPPLLMCGGPGVGKTFFSNELANLVSTYFHIFNMESASAGWIFNGLSDSWSSAQTGKIFKTLTDLDQPHLNPLFLLDELDKANGDTRHPVANTLLPLMERYTAKVFKDECIPLEIDASHIVWFATANSLDTISGPLKSRFDVFEIPSPSFEDKKVLASQIYSAVLKNNTWGHHFQSELPEETRHLLATVMTAGAARDLRRIITIGCSEAAKHDSKELLPLHLHLNAASKVDVWDMNT